MKRSLLLLLAILPFTAAAQPGSDSMVLTQDEAFLMLPPEVVCQPQVIKMTWSPDGGYLLLYRIDSHMSPSSLLQMLTGQQAPTPEASVVLWDNRNRKSSVVWKGNAREHTLEDVGWFKGTSVAMVHIRKSSVDREAKSVRFNHTLIRVDAATGRSSLFPTLAEAQDLHVSFSPAADIGLISAAFSSPEGHYVSQLYATRSSGALSAPIRLAGSQVSAEEADWASDGRAVFITYEVIDPTKRQFKATFHLMDPQTYKFESSDTKPAYYKQQPEPQIVGVSPEKHVVGVRQTKKGLNALWLHSSIPSKFQFALVSGQVDAFELASGVSAVAYTSQGVAMVRPIARLPRAQVEQAILAAERSAIMHKGKQAALGLLMWSADNDDNLPGKDADLRSMIEPYMKDPSSLDGFVYTFSGGSTTAIENPAETPLGYIPGPGGRAMVYADGHVVWIND